MKYSRAHYKQKANELLVNKFQTPVIVLLVIFLTDTIISSVRTWAGPSYSISADFLDITEIPAKMPGLYYILGIVSFIVAALFLYAKAKMFIQIATEEPTDLKNILKTTYQEEPVRSVIMELLASIYISLWTMLLIIPGIVKIYAYSMKFYLASKDHSLSASEAITRSKELTQDSKWELFILDLSYLGWYFLGLLTFGILWLWVHSRHMTARTLMFEEIYNRKTFINVETNLDALERLSR